ncbi:MAG: response regulator [Eisenbergiella sp.]
MIRILLADDDILVLNRLTEMIHKYPEKYEITGQATGGISCLKLLNTVPCDILILDIDMPDKNGVQVSKEIFSKKLPVKILVLSNYDTFAFVRDAMRYGAYDYLLKHQLTDDMLFSKLDELTKIMEQEGLYTSHVTYFTTVPDSNTFLPF